MESSSSSSVTHTSGLRKCSCSSIAGLWGNLQCALPQHSGVSRASSRHRGRGTADGTDGNPLKNTRNGVLVGNFRRIRPRIGQGSKLSEWPAVACQSLPCYWSRHSEVFGPSSRTPTRGELLRARNSVVRCRITAIDHYAGVQFVLFAIGGSLSTDGRHVTTSQAWNSIQSALIRVPATILSASNVNSECHGPGSPDRRQH